ncbi:MAG TPA: hypothetical protein EYP94_04180 [Gammaproteobacteria bacterium]|jgi:hypothetical protein|nr:hypothetical protein [Gammaproteobacteria bacterium]
MKQTQKDYPELNERAIGWLNFLYQKATTSDDWSEDGDPHEWWDRSSTPPMCSFLFLGVLLGFSDLLFESIKFKMKLCLQNY